MGRLLKRKSIPWQSHEMNGFIASYFPLKIQNYHLLLLDCSWNGISPKADSWYFSCLLLEKLNNANLYQWKPLNIWIQFSSVAKSCPTLCDPWTAAHQASLSIINSWSLPELMSIDLVMTSNHLLLCHPLLLLPSIFPSIRVFSNESALRIRWQSIGVSASTSVLPMNTQDWSPLGWTGWISLQSKGLSRIFSNTTVQKHRFFGSQFSL